jgi:hypothetical protein
MRPVVQYRLLYGLKTLFGMERITALPSVLFSDEALMRLVGFEGHQVRQGLCQRGTAKRQGERTLGPICPDTLAKNRVQWHVRDLEMVFNGAMRAVAKAGVVEKQVIGLADGPDLETTERDRGCGQVTRKVRIQEKRGPVHASDVPVSGWQVRRLIAAATEIPLAVKVGQSAEHEPPWIRALVTQARANLAGWARLHKVVFETGVWDGTDLWWLAQHAMPFGGPPKPTWR